MNSLKKRHSGYSDPIKSLELLRSCVQSYFDKEIDVVIRKFVEKFFNPAIKNIKDSLGDDTVVGDEQIQNICCALLDNAKSQYHSNYMPSPGSSMSRSPNTPEMEVSDSDSSSNENSNTGSTSLLQQALKRKRTDSENENLAKRQFFLTTQNPLIQPFSFQPSSQNQLITCSSSTSTFSSNSTLLTPTISTSKITTKQVVWNIAPSSLAPTSLFILDSKVTNALGINDFREKLSTISLFRYVIDNEDLLWLIQQKILQPPQKNGRIYLLILSEIEKYIEQTPEFKNSTNLKQSELTGFKVPEFMYKKIQKFSSSQFLLSVNPQSQNIIVPGNNQFFTKQSFGGQQPISFHIIQTGANRSIGGFSTANSQQIQQIQKFRSLSTTHATLTKLLSNQIQNSNTIQIQNSNVSNNSENSGNAGNGGGSEG